MNFNFKILYPFFYLCLKLGLQKKCMKQINTLTSGLIHAWSFATKFRQMFFL